MDILGYLIKNQKAILEDLKALVEHESPSFDKNLADECAQFIQQLIRDRLNEEGTNYPQSTVGTHMKFEFGEGEQQILILAHYDTVWEQNRLKFYIEENRAYGPGILDMKGGIIQAIWAMKALKELGLTPSMKVCLLITSDEEQLSHTSRKLIEETARASQAVFVVEPPVAKTGALKTRRKGAAQFTIQVYGISSHAGNDPDMQASAIHELAHQIRELESFADEKQGTTLNVGVIQGGLMSNVVADYAQAQVDVRFFSRAEGERMEKQILGLKPIFTKTRVEVQGGINRPPMEKTDESSRLFELAQECARNIGFELTEAAVGGVSDGNFTAAIGIPTLDGLGSFGQGPHAIHEHVVLDEIPKRTALLANLLLRV